MLLKDAPQGSAFVSTGPVARKVWIKTDKLTDIHHECVCIVMETGELVAINGNMEVEIIPCEQSSLSVIECVFKAFPQRPYVDAELNAWQVRMAKAIKESMP